VKTTIDEVGKNKVKLTVEVPRADFESVLSRTYKRLATQIKVPGFRPGKAPKAIIDQRLGRDFVRSELLKDILPDLYAEAVRTTDLDVVAPPAIDVTTFEDDSDLTFEAVVETRPEVVLNEYSGLKATKPPADVDDALVDDQIESLRLRFASLEVTERPLQKGDFAQIDLTTYRHDETIDELTFKDVLIEVGAEMFVPELDAELIGKRKGDILKITASLPERFGERAGWQVGMQILVKETKTRKLPALDDEFAKTASEFDTLDELRSDIRTRLTEMQEAQAEQRLRESVLDAFAAGGVEVELPAGMVDLEVDGLVTNFVQLLRSQNIPVERYLESQNMDGESLRSQFREQAERNLTIGLGLDAVAAAEGVQVTEDDRTRELERLAARTGRSAADLRKLIEERNDWKSVDGDILRSKSLDLLVQRAEVTIGPDESDTEVTPEPAGAGSSEKEPR
jgi:trigger factor